MPSKRSGYWYLIKRIPASIRHLDKRSSPIKITTGISIADDPRGIRATMEIAQLERQLDDYWQGLAQGEDRERPLAFANARKIAKQYGHEYISVEKLPSGPVLDLVDRAKTLSIANRLDNNEILSSVLGTVPKPKMLLNDLVAWYEEHQSPSMRDYSDDQRRKWRNPKIKAINNLIGVIGDKAVEDLKRDDALDFRQWWHAKLTSEQLDTGTANKDIGHINSMIRTLIDTMRLDMDSPFARLRFTGTSAGQRMAYTADYVQQAFLCDNAFEGINEEARRVVYLLSETGLRLSEAINLTRERIHLDAPIPFIEVRADGRRLKTPQSARDIPLVGSALLAMREQPDGFPRYRQRPDTVSATLNKALIARNLRPSEGQSIYSLRHTFEDRLTAVEAPEKIIATLMGHKWQRPKYGSGPSLAQKHDWLSRIAFTPPNGV